MAKMMRMQRRTPAWRRVARALAALCLTAACQGLETPARGPETGAPAVRLNAAAQERYQLTARFADAPGPIGALTGVAHYRVTNSDCAPLDASRAVGGVRLAPLHDLPITWRANGEGAYLAQLTADALLDEDYFGLGVCHWTFDGVDVHFASPATAFVGVLRRADIAGGAPKTEHYLVRDYATRPPVGDAVFGEAQDFHAPAMGPHFTLTLSARPAP